MGKDDKIVSKLLGISVGVVFRLWCRIKFLMLSDKRSSVSYMDSYHKGSTVGERGRKKY